MNQGLPIVKKISEVDFENDNFVLIKGDNENIFEFEKTKFCKKPFVGIPCKVDYVNGKVIPVVGYDAIIDNKYHLIKILSYKSSNHISIESYTDAKVYVISLDDLRP